MKIELAAGVRVTMEMHRTAWLIQQCEDGQWFTRAVVTEGSDLLREETPLGEDLDSVARAILQHVPKNSWGGGGKATSNGEATLRCLQDRDDWKLWETQIKAAIAMFMPSRSSL